MPQGRETYYYVEFGINKKGVLVRTAVQCVESFELQTPQTIIHDLFLYATACIYPSTHLHRRRTEHRTWGGFGLSSSLRDRKVSRREHASLASRPSLPPRQNHCGQLTAN